MSTSFTPGPWQAFAGQVRSSEDYVLLIGKCERGMDFPEMHANVHLASLAPELRDALKRTMDAIDETPGMRDVFAANRALLARIDGQD